MRAVTWLPWQRGSAAAAPPPPGLREAEAAAGPLLAMAGALLALLALLWGSQVGGGRGLPVFRGLREGGKAESRDWGRRSAGRSALGGGGDGAVARPQRPPVAGLRGNRPGGGGAVGVPGPVSLWRLPRLSWPWSFSAGA